MIADLFRFDFGYGWVWTLGHLIPVVIGFSLVLLALHLRWRRWLVAVFAALGIWGLAGLWITNIGLRFSLPTKLPAIAFATTPAARILDAGAGSGRATVMILRARPDAQITALDLFHKGYGIDDNSPARLDHNVAAIDARKRVEIVSGDMRRLTFGNDIFDGVISAYAIDHLSRDDIARSLAEFRRVLKPGGQVLFYVMDPDLYVRIAFPLAVEHGYFGAHDAKTLWTRALTSAGFTEIGTGRHPSTLYVVARSPD